MLERLLSKWGFLLYFAVSLLLMGVYWGIGIVGWLNEFQAHQLFGGWYYPKLTALLLLIPTLLIAYPVGLLYDYLSGQGMFGQRSRDAAALRWPRKDMPSKGDKRKSPISIHANCPACQTAYTLGEHLHGKKVRCKKCGDVFLVKKTLSPSDELDEEEDEAAEAREQIQLRPRSSKRPAVYDDEEAPPRRQRKQDDEPSLSQRRRRWILVLALVGGCLTLCLAAGAAVLAIRYGRGMSEMFDSDFGGSWPVRTPPAGYGAGVPEDSIVTLHVIAVTDESTHDAIYGKATALADDGHASYICAARQGERMTVRLGLVRDPQACANKIDFGTVRGVSGRTINVVANRVEGPPPNADDLTMTLYDLKSPMGHRRHDAIQRLKTMAPNERRPEVVRALEEALRKDTNPFDREELVKMLAVWGGKDSVPALLKTLQSLEKHDFPARRAIFHALARLQDERACEPIAVYLEDFPSRHDAAEALKAMGPIAEKAALKRLEHPDQFLRQEVCDILAVIGTKESLPALEKVAAQNDFVVSGKAQTAIQAIKARQK